MSRFGFSAQMLSRCGSSWVRATPAVAPMGSLIATPLCHGARQVSTTRPKKAQAMKDTVKKTNAAAPKETTAKARASPSTKKAVSKASVAPKEEAPEVKATPAKKTRAPKAKTGADLGTETKKAASKKTTTPAEPEPSTTAAATVPTPSTINASKLARNTSLTASSSPLTTTTNTPSAASTGKKEETVASTPKKTQGGRISSSSRFAPSQIQPAREMPVPAAAPMAEPTTPPRSPDGSKRPSDPSSTRYKQAVWKWTSTMVALPILIVSSYLLLDRLALGNEPKLEELRQRIRGGTTGDVETGDATTGTAK